MVTWGTWDFHSYMKNAGWNDVPGVYIFAELDRADGRWFAHYIGQTSSFKDRLPSHDRWMEAVERGATHIHAKTVGDRDTRITMEKELIESYKPAMNR